MVIARNGMASISGTATLDTILYGIAVDPFVPITVLGPASLILMEWVGRILCEKKILRIV